MSLDHHLLHPPEIPLITPLEEKLKSFLLCCREARLSIWVEMEGRWMQKGRIVTLSRSPWSKATLHKLPRHFESSLWARSFVAFPFHHKTNH